jgi:ferredoxin
MRNRRKIIRIDEEKCTGCGQCIPNCPEGALQLIDGKARLVSDLFCDGLGACIGHCPEGAITIEERPAEPYDEDRVMENIVKAGPATIAAHLAHLRDHGATEYHQAALAYLKRHNIPVPAEQKSPQPCSCPSATPRRLSPRQSDDSSPTRTPVSRLGNWPIQLTLVPITAPYLQHADILLAADCVAAAHPAFHDSLLNGKVLLIACPKLDDAGFYKEKLTELLRVAQPKSITVAHMTVPCCYGLVEIVRQALTDSKTAIPLTELTIDIEGNIVPDKQKELKE